MAGAASAFIHPRLNPLSANHSRRLAGCTHRNPTWQLLTIFHCVRRQPRLSTTSFNETSPFRRKCLPPPTTRRLSALTWSGRLPVCDTLFLEELRKLGGLGEDSRAIRDILGRSGGGIQLQQWNEVLTFCVFRQPELLPC